MLAVFPNRLGYQELSVYLTRDAGALQTVFPFESISAVKLRKLMAVIMEYGNESKIINACYQVVLTIHSSRVFFDQQLSMLRCVELRWQL